MLTEASSIVGVIDPQELQETCFSIEQNPHFRMVRNALTQTCNHPIAQNWDAIRSKDFTFSHQISSSFAATDQKISGRCWIFGALNVLRSELKKKLPFQDFEFSQSYLFFYDKAEKANVFLERVIETWEEPLDRPRIRFLLEHPIEDGGDWHIFIDLVKKYGLVPKSAYPENAACDFSPPFNKILTMRLIKDAFLIREGLQSGVSIEAIRDAKAQMLKEIYQILVVHMGAPPTTFDYTHYDTASGMLYEIKNTTPLEFAKECLVDPLDDYVILVHSPRKETPYYTNCQISSSNNMVEGKEFVALNLPIEEIKELAKNTLLADTAVSFAADILNQSLTPPSVT
jgi:bleomycin hydrolase